MCCEQGFMIAGHASALMRLRIGCVLSVYITPDCRLIHSRRYCCCCRIPTSHQWRFHAGAGGQPPPLIVARPPNLAVLLTHCGQLILRKINKFDATRCHILSLKCKTSISVGALPQTPLGRSLQRSPTLPSCIQGGLYF